jgi:hypothetical protein
MSKKKIKIGQEELDQYKFDRKDIALMLNKSTNAIRMMMRKSNCKLEYRFDGKKFWFKRPREGLVDRPPSDHHEKAVNQLHNKIQKKYNRGATHKGQGKYSNDAFKLQNEMKILNNIGGKFRSESHRREFDKLNEEALKIAQNNLQKKEQKEHLSQYKNPNKYGGMITVKGMQNIDDQEHARLGRNWYRYNASDYNQGSSMFFGNFNGKAKEAEGSVEIDPRDLPLDDREPEFNSKIDESIWRLKNKK